MIRTTRKRKVTIARKSKRMTARDAIRAIIIDFEGRKGYRPHPDLIGIHDPFEPPESRFYQVILTKRLAPAARAGGGHAVEDLPALILRLVARAEANRAFIVSFSQHDLGMIEKQVGKEDRDLCRRFKRVYRDANARARRWVNGSRYVPLMPKGEDFNLQRYLDFIGYRSRRNYREAKVSDTLRTMHLHLKAGRPYMKLRKKDKRHWHNVLGHNRRDVEGTRELLLIATGAREWEPPRAA